MTTEKKSPKKEVPKKKTAKKTSTSVDKAKTGLNIDPKK